MSHTFSHELFCFLAITGIALMVISPVHAFTANSLDITISKDGDATASFRFTLEGILENAIPQSMLEEELKKGLTTSSDPPVLLSMDKSGATLLLKKFADTADVPQGTEYRTASMNFQKAEIALKNSAISNVVSADFTPDRITLTFPDAYTKTFANTAVLPSLTHVVIDPSKPAVVATPAKTGSINITASPPTVQVSIDGSYAGDSPGTFSELTAGPHTLLFQKEGFLPVTKTITVVEGRTTSAFVYLKYAEQPTTAAPGLLSLPGFDLALAALALGSCFLVRRISR